MKDWIKRALTHKTSRRKEVETTTEIPPNERLVLGVKFAIAITFSLTALEITHLIVLKQWSSEIFSAITGLTGTIMGIFITQKT